MEKDEELFNDEDLNDDLDDIEEIDVEEETAEGQEVAEEEGVDNADNNKHQKKKQTAGERKAHAEARRKREAKEKEEAKNKAFQEGVIQGLGGINPYTNEKIEDDIDYELYNEMKEAEKNGYDPTDTVELNKYRKSLKQEALRQKEAEEKSKLDITKDLEDFVKEHQEIDVKELLKDEKFSEFAEDLVGKLSLNKIYDKFKSFSREAEEKAKDLALKKQARESASEGSLEGNEGEDLYTLDQIKGMSREEIDNNFEKVQRSMQKYYN